MIGLALAVLLHFQDPVGDAVGNGSLQPPTAAIYRDLAALDITGFSLYDTPTLSFSLSFAQLDNPYNLPNGFSLPIIELYFEDTRAANGSTTLLPGSMMQLPSNQSWHYAVKLTGDVALLYQGMSEEQLDLSSAHSILLEVEDTTITVTTSLARPDALRVYGMVGNYTPFNETGWQSISSSPSPWAYSSETQVRPVVDILASSFELQQQAIDTGILPPMQVTRSNNTWQILMITGLLIAMAGVVSRFFWRRPRPLLVPLSAAPASPQAEIDLSMFDKTLAELSAARKDVPVNTEDLSAEDTPKGDLPADTKSESLPEVIDLRTKVTVSANLETSEDSPSEALTPELDTGQKPDTDASGLASSDLTSDDTDPKSPSEPLAAKPKEQLEHQVDVYSLKSKTATTTKEAVPQADFAASDWDNTDEIVWETSKKSSG